jgi:predicted GIY-YIG superfamily endonuclease
MAGLDPAIHAFLTMPYARESWMGLYSYQPPQRRVRLVYFERHDEVVRAIAREKAIKKWPRRWKVQLITKDNFDWEDLYDGIL